MTHPVISHLAHLIFNKSLHVKKYKEIIFIN